MSSDLTIQAIATIRAGGDSAEQQRMAGPVPLAPLQQAVASSPIPNPSLRLDAGLGLVVIEFRNDAGNVTASIPSKRQIEAYQRWETTHFGPVPAGRRGGQTSEPQPAPAPAPAAGSNDQGIVKGSTRRRA